MLFLFCVALQFTLRGVSRLVLPFFLSMCFFCFFSILITLLGEEGIVFVLIVHLFVSYAHVNLCHFPLPPGVRGWLRLLLGLFLGFSVYLFNDGSGIKLLTKLVGV